MLLMPPTLPLPPNLSCITADLHTCALREAVSERRNSIISTMVLAEQQLAQQQQQQQRLAAEAEAMKAAESGATGQVTH